MRENRTYGSEGGEAQTNALSLPLSTSMYASRLFFHASGLARWVSMSVKAGQDRKKRKPRSAQKRVGERRNRPLDASSSPFPPVAFASLFRWVSQKRAT